MLDSKLAGLEERIVNRIIDWFIKNTIVEGVNKGEEGKVDKGLDGEGVRSSPSTQHRATKHRPSHAQPVELNDEGGRPFPSTQHRATNLRASHSQADEINAVRVDGVDKASSIDLS